MSVNESAPDRKKQLIRVAKLLVLVVVVAAVGRAVANAWRELGTIQVRAEWLLAAAALYLAGLFPSSLFWYRALRALGQEPRLYQAIRAYFIGHLGKYIPGKAMVVILRAGLVRGPRVDTGVAAASVFLETFTYLAVGSFLAAAFLTVYLREQQAYLFGAIGLMAATAVPTIPPIFARLARLARVGKSNPDVLAKLDRLGYQTILSGWFLMAIGWVLMGLSYWATLRAMGLEIVDPLEALPRYTASVALATVAGFVAIVIPAGMGVREVVLTMVMVSYFQQLDMSLEQAKDVSLVSAGLWRLVSIVAEAAISGILYVAYLRRADQPPPHS